MKHQLFFCLLVSMLGGQTQAQTTQKDKDFKLVWSDEFNKDGAPDPSNWSFEEGFVRNHEHQWYQPQNAYCKNGLLVIEARREQKPNPNYAEGSNDWRKDRKTIDYTSACLITKGKQQWLYGRWEMRARIDISAGSWPAWWALGVSKPWPSNGEIDMMEYYRDSLLANIATGTGTPHKAFWYSKKKPVDAKWASKFHVWRMDWDSTGIALYVDDFLLNHVLMGSLVNKDNTGFNPFKQPQYMLLNFAIGGDNGGDPANSRFPSKFEVDYVRVYQRK
ncbi:MAG TPA: glycoside hydrolase family 16 protein [Puia sp.]|nr:glycoside hydrolase family 16 protein [Puia sp.]